MTSNYPEDLGGAQIAAEPLLEAVLDQIEAEAQLSKKRYATLPNCSQCGRFTSKPEIFRWCEGGNSGAHTCFELLLCPRCAEKKARENRSFHAL